MRAAAGCTHAPAQTGEWMSERVTVLKRPRCAKAWWQPSAIAGATCARRADHEVRVDLSTLPRLRIRALDVCRGPRWWVWDAWRRRTARRAPLSPVGTPRLQAPPRSSAASLRPDDLRPCAIAGLPWQPVVHRSRQHAARPIHRSLAAAPAPRGADRAATAGARHPDSAEGVMSRLANGLGKSGHHSVDPLTGGFPMHQSLAGRSPRAYTSRNEQRDSQKS